MTANEQIDQITGAARPARHLAAREVLDLHADLQRMMADADRGHDPALRRIMADYAVEDANFNLAWAASHLHPSTSFDDLDPWLHSLGTDLFGAVTYQVTAEMTDLAEALRQTTPDLAEIRDGELPSPWGFMWLDKPVLRPSVDDDGRLPLLMHAVSWARVPAVKVQDQRDGRMRTLPGVRIREWAWDDRPSVRPRPLHIIGQSVVPVAAGAQVSMPELWTVHMLWILMGMEIVSLDPEPAGRAGRKRAANLRRQEVRVVRLRRAKHDQAPGGLRKVDWSCTWLVRGHWRNAPHGGTFRDGRTRTWVKAYLKGPDGLPLSVRDIVHRLDR
jgi:hypothetical protein